MSTAPSAPIAPQELRRAQEEAGVELVNGQLAEKPVSIESGAVEARIAWLLASEAEKTRSVRIFTSSMGYQCFADDPAGFRKPDVSAVRCERLAGLDPRTALIPFPPDLAVEVVSPTDVAYDLTDKVEQYLRNGFPLVWVVHPNTRVVHVHRANASVSVLHEQDEITGETALPGFRCKVAEFFRL